MYEYVFTAVLLQTGQNSNSINWPVIVIPVLVTLISFFAIPFFEKLFRREYNTVEKRANESDILGNYATALKDAWEQINKLKEELETHQKDAAVKHKKLETEYQLLAVENVRLQNRIRELERKLGERHEL